MTPSAGPAGSGAGGSGYADSPEARRRSRGITFRKWNRILHRDVGYLVAGLTVIYAVSGVAVNHIRDWNPNYKVTEETVDLPVAREDLVLSQPFIDEVVGAFALEGPIRGTFQPDPETLNVYLEEGAITVDLTTGAAVFEGVRPRWLLREANILHLNEPRSLWTWIADAFAVALAFLALSGLFMIKGRKGITGRGAWLTAAGVAVPLVFLLLYL